MGLSRVSRRSLAQRSLATRRRRVKRPMRRDCAMFHGAGRSHPPGRSAVARAMAFNMRNAMTHSRRAFGSCRVHARRGSASRIKWQMTPAASPPVAGAFHTAGDVGTSRAFRASGARWRNSRRSGYECEVDVSVDYRLPLFQGARHDAPPRPRSPRMGDVVYLCLSAASRVSIAVTCRLIGTLRLPRATSYAQATGRALEGASSARRALLMMRERLRRCRRAA